MKVLLDTCTLAELATKPRPNAGVIEAIQAIPAENLFVSVLSVGEIGRGVARLASGKKRDALTLWLSTLERQFAARILGIDIETSKLWGELTGRAGKKGVVIPAVDGLIAATALRHGLHVMTRNVKDFDSTGARVVNPWKSPGN